MGSKNGWIISCQRLNDLLVREFSRLMSRGYQSNMMMARLNYYALIPSTTARPGHHFKCWCIARTRLERHATSFRSILTAGTWHPRSQKSKHLPSLNARDQKINCSDQFVTMRRKINNWLAKTAFIYSRQLLCKGNIDFSIDC